MNDPYDWRGRKEPTVCATEADAFAAITMQLLKYISGGLPTLFMDVRLDHPKLDIWDWCNSGNHASWYAAQSYDPAVNFKKHQVSSCDGVLFQGRRGLGGVRCGSRRDDVRENGHF